jgi:hypothetical protein
MSDTSTVFPTEAHWESEGTSRIPFLTYTSDELYKRELERFFYKNHWCYVGLEAEVPNAGDFKRTVVGERSVIMTRDAEASAASATAIARSSSALITSGATRSRVTCKACRSGGASSRMAKCTPGRHFPQSRELLLSAVQGIDTLQRGAAGCEFRSTTPR